MKANASRTSDEAPAPAGGASPAAIAAFLSSLAHIIRSPLGVVTQTLTEIRTDCGASLTDEHRKLLAYADRGMLRIRRMSDTVSLVAQLEAGELDLRRGPVDLVALLSAAVASAAAIEPRDAVLVACELPEGACVCEADADRLTRAVAEIVINGVRHARRRVRVSLTTSDDTARVAIEDDGAGVPENRRATLFKRFTGQPSRTGLGLGLSIAHDIITAHGGTLTFEESTLPPGRPGTVGARFVMSFPIIYQGP